MSFFIKPTCVGIATLSLLVAGPSFATPERLEAELTALFADGELRIGDVSKAVLRDRFTAEDIVYESPEGERLKIERYIVSGNYDSPDEVRVEGIRVEDSLTELLLMSIDSAVFGEPGMAVFNDESMQQTPLNLANLSIDNIALDLNSELAGDFLYELGIGPAPGRLEIAEVRGEQLSADTIGMLEFSGVAMQGEDLGDLGSGSLLLDRLRIEALHGMQGEQDEHLGAMIVENMAIESDTLVASLERLKFDGDFNDGEGGAWIETLELDLNRMIALAPPSERTNMRMVSNVLTDGSGTLAVDAHFEGLWKEQESQSVLGGDSRIMLHDAIGLNVNYDIPVVLPKNTTPVEALRDTRLLDAATLLGGDVTLTLDDEGLLARLVTLGATMEGVSEAQIIEQARTQAKGFGMMFGPEVQSVLLGMVELLEGNASQLVLNITLPAESNLNTYAQDPLGLPSQLSLQVETR
ncbi:hypothetical protein LOS15_05675 [Halomonas sp. 7T]|uniref:hypothetical protein n=1 Tax=Halomonas sp. 7T TaxID=2893469 RepID=UPI0021DA2128|nr:hypothetical protein [Halomonas sp. 7T]UXZ55515.1 hypothetical protein LOS15_05675 [Halomonas sp. 7T]